MLGLIVVLRFGRDKGSVHDAPSPGAFTVDYSARKTETTSAWTAVDMKKSSTFLRWSIVILLAAGACWTANLTLFNWWVAGGPPTANPEVFRTRGNVFAVVTVLLFAAAGVLGVQAHGRSKRRLAQRGADRHERHDAGSRARDE